MSEENKKILYNYAGDIPEKFKDLMDEIGVVIVDELPNEGKLQYVLVNHYENSFSELDKVLETVKNDTHIISLSEVPDVKEFMAYNGKSVIDVSWLETTIGQKIIQKIFTDDSSVHLDEKFQGLFDNVNTIKIDDHISLGSFSDRLAFDAYKDDFNIIAVRTFLYNTIYYFTYLSDNELSGLPFEVDYTIKDNLMVVQAHANVENFVLEYVIDSLSSLDMSNPYRSILYQALRMTEFFDIDFFDKAGKLVITGVWDKEKGSELKKSFSVNSIPLSKHIINSSDIGLVVAQPEILPELRSEVEGIKLPGEIAEVAVNNRGNSILADRPDELFAALVHIYTEAKKENIESYDREGLEKVLSSFTNQGFVKDLGDREYLEIERLYNKKPTQEKIEGYLARKNNSLTSSMMDKINDRITSKLANIAKVEMPAVEEVSAEELLKDDTPVGQDDIDALFDTDVAEKSDEDRQGISDQDEIDKLMNAAESIPDGPVDQDNIDSLFDTVSEIKEERSKLDNDVNRVEGSIGVDDEIQRVEGAPEDLDDINNISGTKENLDDIQKVSGGPIEEDDSITKISGDKEDLDDIQKISGSGPEDLDENFVVAGDKDVIDNSSQVVSGEKENLDDVQKIEGQKEEKDDFKAVFSADAKEDEGEYRYNSPAEITNALKEAAKDLLGEGQTFTEVADELAKKLSRDLNIPEQTVKDIVSEMMNETVHDEVLGNEGQELMDILIPGAQGNSNLVMKAKDAQINKLKLENEELKAKLLSAGSANSIIDQARSKAAEELAQAMVPVNSLAPDEMPEISEGKALTQFESDNIKRVVEEGLAARQALETVQNQLRALQNTHDGQTNFYETQVKKLSADLKKREQLIFRTKELMSGEISKRELQIKIEKERSNSLRQELLTAQSKKSNGNNVTGLLKEENRGLSRQVEMLNKKIATLQEESATSVSQTDDKMQESKIKTLEATKENLTSQLKQKENESKTYYDKMKELEKEVEKLRSESSAGGATGLQQAQDQEKVTNDLREKDEVIKAASEKLADAEKKIKQLDHKLKMTNALLEKSKGSGSSGLGAAAGGGNGNDKSAKKLKLVEKQFEKTQEDLKKANSAVTEAKKNAARLKSENMTMKNELEKLKRENNKLKKKAA